MSWFRDLPIRYKVTLIMMIASTNSLLLATLAAFGYEVARFRAGIVSDIGGQAKILVAATAGALAARDERAVGILLAALRTQPEIVYGRILGNDGRMVAQYVRPGPQPVAHRAALGGTGHWFEGGRLYFRVPVADGQQTLGTLVLCADARELRDRLKGGASILVVVMLASVLVALILATRLQRLIVDPILELGELAQQVAARQDFSLRSGTWGQDEIGELAGHFNAMLARIQEHREAMLKSEERFRQVTESIKEVFWLSDPGKNDMLYVSPAYESIWARPCGRLYQEPRDGLAAVHPEDRPRVLESALHNQTLGLYDEEYRILRPNGSVRWIRDRAFPVRDQDGRIYRIAGVAEDITTRKELEREVLETGDREQARIGRELHDGLCQLLVSIAFNVGVLKKDLLARGCPELARAERIERRLGEAVRVARHLAQGLCSTQVRDNALGAALQELARNTTQDFDVLCLAEGAEGFCVPDGVAATHLYRIAHEAVHNAVKHAKPSRITIEWAAAAGRIQLTITDDGVGLPASLPPGAGVGLQIMRYRAGATGGRLELRRAAGGGTVVSCSCPVSKVTSGGNHVEFA